MDQEKQEIRVANIFSEALTKILRHSLNDDFRSTCFDAFGVTNSQDFQKACVAETLRNIRPKPMPEVLQPTLIQTKITEDVKPSFSQITAETQLTGPTTNHEFSSLPFHESENHDQSEIEVIVLDSSDDDCTPDDCEEGCFTQSTQNISSDLSDDECNQDDCEEGCSTQSTRGARSQQPTPPTTKSQLSTSSNVASQLSTHSTIISQQSTPPCLSQLFDF